MTFITAAGDMVIKYVYKKLKINYNFRKQKLKYITTASKAMTAALQRITANEINKPTCYKVEGSSGSYTFSISIE